MNGNLFFLSFLRLVGAEYFRKCANEFKDICTPLAPAPASLFSALSCTERTDLENRIVFIDRIREALFKRFDEEKYIPSVDALRLHWRRSCWAAEVWQQSDKPITEYPDLQSYG